MDFTALCVAIIILSGQISRVDASTEGCPDIVLRSPHFAKVHASTCYLFVNEEHYWNDARSACWNMGGEMLSIRDDSTMQFIRSVLSSRQLRWFKQGVWLGARYIRGRWRWTTGVKLEYNNWAPGEPSKLLGLFSVEDCALMRRNDNWQWHDFICGSLKFHYNYICEFRFNSIGHYEQQTGSHSKDNGNMAILTIILTTGGIVLLILLVVFLVVRRRYNYKKLISQPDVHFDNRNYNLAVCQPAPLSQAGHSNPPAPSHLSNSRPSSNLYLDPVELRPGPSQEAQKPNDVGVHLLKESAHSEESPSTSPTRSDEDLGACGGVPLQEMQDHAAAGGVAGWAQSEEGLSQKNAHSHDDYVDMYENPVTLAHDRPEGKAIGRLKEDKQSCSEEGDGNSPHGSGEGEENQPYTTPNYSNLMTSSQHTDNVYEDFP